MKNTSRTGPAGSRNGSKNEQPQRVLKENAAENAAKKVPEKIPEDVAEDSDSVATDSEEDSTPSDQNEQEQGDTKNAEGAVDGKGQADGATESVLAGIVDAEGNVVDGEGNVVGKVTRDVPEGSMVDTEGDVLDIEGNIIGSAQPIDEAVKEGRENASESATGVENRTEQPTSETPGGSGAKPDAGEGAVELEDDVDKAASISIFNNAPSDYSDAPSVDLSHPSTQKRRNKRGGRKIRGRMQSLQSVSEFGIPNRKDQEHHSPTQPESRDEDDSQASDSNSISHESGTEKARDSKSSWPSVNGKPKADTGIRAFNLKRAESSGGGPPIAVVVERTKSKRKPKSDSKARNSWEHSDKEEDETERTKCLQIRFDLNLEVEIFLKAKIKGDVTVTFLE